MSTFPKYGRPTTQKPSCSSINCFETCADIDALDIINQFRKMYERKLQEIDCEGGGDCFEMKISIQQKWIDDLSEQTVMMAEVIKELEQEAKERVQMLDDKLQHSAQAIYESDCKNLIEFIRRIREDGQWSMDGLKFHEVTVKDLFGDKGHLAGRDSYNITEKRSYEKSLSPLKDTLNIPTFGSINAESTKTDKDNEKMEELGKELKKKDKEIQEIQQAMIDMRDALTEEVACKHDLVLLLKKDIQQLEERLVQSDKQIAFKEDIIKELRKEIKHLRQQEQSQSKQCFKCGQPKTSPLCCKSSKRKFRSRESSPSSSPSVKETRSLPSSPTGSDQEDLGEEIMEKQQTEKVLIHLGGRMSPPQDKKKKGKRNESCSSPTSSCIRKKAESGTEDRRVSFEDIIHSPLLQEKSVAITSNVPIRESRAFIQIDQHKMEPKEMEEKIAELEETIRRKDSELQELEICKFKCKELENALQNSCGRAENLQKAVNLYLNSIEILEGSEEKAKIEIEQQRVTIYNLQEALVLAKQELDEFRLKSQQDVSLGWTARWFRQPTPQNKTQNNNNTVHDI